VQPADIQPAGTASIDIDIELPLETTTIAGGPFGAGIAVSRRPSSGRSWATTGLIAAVGLVFGMVGGAVALRVWSDESTLAESTPNIDARGGLPADRDVPGAADETDRARDVPAARVSARRPAASRDVRPAVVDRGRLVVRSEPSGALVTIGGRLLGETPIDARDLAPGTYDVRVAHPGHVPRTEQVTLGAATPVRTLSVTLQRGLPPVTSGRGAIDVDSRPRGARVLVDGRFVGLAPLRVAEIVAGEHEITLELGGYHPATGRVRVEPGRAEPLRLTLRAAQ
jgi:hypothetical protein